MLVRLLDYGTVTNASLNKLLQSQSVVIISRKVFEIFFLSHYVKVSLIFSYSSLYTKLIDPFSSYEK